METPCILWPGKRDPEGYARIGNRLVHRIVFQQVIRPLEHWETVDHLCRVRHCINPQHFEAVTRGENVLRGESPSAVNARRTHCTKGHPLVEENILTYTRNGHTKRRCRTCHRDYERVRRAR
jgi:hypothetical protein